jgi:glycosyl transferase family 25
MHIFVINLPRSPQRKRHMEEQLSAVKADYEFVVAVDGRDVDLGDQALLDPSFRSKEGFRPGALGCALSHAAALGQVLDDHHDRAVIVEDDVDLPPDFVELAEAVGPQLNGAEIALFNFHSPGRCRVVRDGSTALGRGRLLVNPASLVGLTSAGAYMVTADACRSLRQGLFPLETYFDDWAYHGQRGALRAVRCLVPMPVANSPRFRSTMDYYPPTSWQSRLRDGLNGARLPLIAPALTMRRQRGTFRRLGWTGKYEFVEYPGATEDAREQD